MRIRLVTAVPGCVGAVALLAACSGKEEGGEEQAASQAAPPVSPLTNPSAPEMNQTAPDVYRVKFETSAGDFEI